MLKVQLVKSRISLRIILDTVKINNDPELDLYRSGPPGGLVWIRICDKK